MTCDHWFLFILLLMTQIFWVFKCLCYRDLGLHKLVFGENGLPDGTEVGYYVRGQVVTVRSHSFHLIILIAPFLFFFFQQLYIFAAIAGWLQKGCWNPLYLL